MQRKYTKTFLDITSDDIENFVTIRRRLDNPHQHRFSIEEITGLLSNHETEVKFQEENCLNLIKEKELIEKEIKEIKYQTEKLISFPYQSFLNLRHWRKAPKNLKLFFQALSCLFSIPNNDFLTKLKANKNLLNSYQPSSNVMDEFRMKYFHLKEISPEYFRKKSVDAYVISIWMQNIEENERLNRIEQPKIENQKQLEKQLIQLNINLLAIQKEIELTKDKIQNLKKNLNQTEKHRQTLFQSN